MEQIKIADSVEFQPDADNPKLLRRAYGRFATGVTVITCAGDDGPIGMTANSFSSISLEPALVMWSPATASTRYRYFAKATHFAIHVLGAGQQSLCQNFAKSATGFDTVSHRISDHGVPLIKGCLARFECRTHSNHAAGDHQIIVGEVLKAQMREGDPLAFFGGEFGAFKSGS